MEAINENKFSFWALPESPNPPHDPYSGNLFLFFLGVGSGVGREIFEEPKKTNKVQDIGIFGRKGLLF